MDAMDKFDWKIIQALQKWAPDESEIGDLIGLSASQCSRRRQLLEQKELFWVIAPAFILKLWELQFWLWFRSISKHMTQQQDRFSTID